MHGGSDRARADCLSGILLGIAVIFPGLFLSSILFFHLLCSRELRPGLVVAAGIFYAFVALTCSLFWKAFREALSGIRIEMDVIGE